MTPYRPLKSLGSLWGAVFLVCLTVWSASGALAEKAPETAEFPSLISAIRLTKSLDFCGEQIPLSRQTVRERMEKELLLALWNRPQVILWLKRAGRYMPHIERMLRDSGMPEDLKYISVVESALRPHIRSPKGATGFWQFMRGTGRKYGLTINSRVDERRNIFLSTAAAIRYLKDLYAMFGSWTLAAAAYNMGEQGLKAEMTAQGIGDYYRLYLPQETQRYLPRIIAVKLILSDPERHGFLLKPADVYPVLTFDRVRLTSPERIPLLLAARAARIHFSEIKQLNPEIRGHYLHRGEYRLLLPKGASEGFNDRFAVLLKDWRQKRHDCIYEVKPGDNLSVIADRFDVPLPALLIWNNRNPRKTLHPGEHLIVCPDGVGTKKQAKK